MMSCCAPTSLPSRKGGHHPRCVWHLFPHGTLQQVVSRAVLFLDRSVLRSLWRGSIYLRVPSVDSCLAWCIGYRGRAATNTRLNKSSKFVRCPCGTDKVCPRNYLHDIQKMRALRALLPVEVSYASLPDHTQACMIQKVPVALP